MEAWAERKKVGRMSKKKRSLHNDKTSERSDVVGGFYKQKGMLMFHTHSCLAPWQTDEWREQMREQLRPNAFLRMIENRFVSGEDNFVPMEWWDACVVKDYSPVVADKDMAVSVGLDAGYRHDYTAVVVCTYDKETKKVYLVWHKIFRPTKGKELDFEATVEATLLDLKRRFRVREVRYDPYQMVAVAQRLKKSGLRMVEFPQTVGNLTEASSNLYDLIKHKNLVVYPDADIRLAVSRAVAVESSRGWRITKTTQSHKIDFVIALAQAALGSAKSAARKRHDPLKLAGAFTGGAGKIPAYEYRPDQFSNTGGGMPQKPGHPTGGYE